MRHAVGTVAEEIRTRPGIPRRAGLEPLGTVRWHPQPSGRAGAQHVPVRLEGSVPGQLRAELLHGQVPGDIQNHGRGGRRRGLAAGFQ